MILSEENRTLFAKYKALPWIFLLVLSLGGIAVVLYATRWGAGLIDDSFIYITSAKNFAIGRGLSWPAGDGSLQPMTHYPPMFPFALAGFQLLGVDAVVAARMINAVAFGILICLTVLLTRSVTRSWGFAMLAGIIVAFSDVLIEASAWAMSEPLYFCLGFAGFYVFGVYLARSRRIWLIISALLIALAFLTRYIGISSLLAIGLFLLLFQDAPWRRRFVDLFIFTGISLLPMAIWVVHTLTAINRVTDRSFATHLVTIKQLTRVLNTIFIWFIPGRLVNGREVLFGAGFLVLVVLLGILYRRKRLHGVTDPTAYGLRVLLIIYVIFYVILLLVSKSFFDTLTPFNDRMLSPVLVSLIILFVAVLANIWRAYPSAIRYAILALSVVFVLFYFLRASDLVTRLHTNGLGFARKGAVNSETFQYIRTLPPVPLFSNSPAAIYMWTGRPAYSIINLAQMRNSMKTDHAVLIVFHSVSLDLYDVSLSDLTQGLSLVKEYRDGSIYQLSQ